MASVSDEVIAIQDYTESHYYRQLRQFVGLVDFYRLLTPNCAETHTPLPGLLQVVRHKFAFLEDAKHAFIPIKDPITKCELLTSRLFSNQIYDNRCPRP